MSKEQLNEPEAQHGAEQFDDSVQQERVRSSVEKAARNTETASDDKLEQVRRTIEREATSSSEMVDNDKNSAPTSFTPSDRAASFSQTMTDVRAKLSGNEQRFSKIIHQPVIEKISNVASKSLGRSSLLLGGFMATFIGSLVIYLNARTNGYSVSNLAFIVILFIVGAAVGLALEIIYRTIKRYLNGQ